MCLWFLLGWGHFLLFGPYGLFGGLWLRLGLGCDNFDLILGLFFTFWGPNGLFLGSMLGSKTVLGSANVVEQLSFSMIP